MIICYAHMQYLNTVHGVKNYCAEEGETGDEAKGSAL